MQMNQQGMSLAEMRAFIDANYAGEMTPTEAVPGT